MNLLRRLGLVALLCASTTAVRAERLVDPIDYGAIATDEPRFYLSGIVGSSWSTLTISDPEPAAAVDPVFTSGAAAGMSFERTAGRLRLEIEGRGHGTLGTSGALEGQVTTFQATDTWSALVNLWRDIDITDRLSLYAGGGVGGGGYQLGYSSAIPLTDTATTGTAAIGSFAWQAGCGVNYALNDRITLDLGYRFFAIGGGTLDVTTRQSGIPIESGRLNNAFSASEVLLGVRIYEPFRRWR